MPTISQKKRTKLITQTEIDAIESLTQGETLPSEYIPAIDINNIIDKDEAIGNQGDASNTGIVGKFAQKTIDYLLSGLGKIRTSMFFGNTQSAGNNNKISSKMLVVGEANSPLGNINENGFYTGSNIYNKTEIDTKLKEIPSRIQTWGKGDKVNSSGQYGVQTISATDGYITVWQSDAIPLGVDGFTGEGLKITARLAIENKQDNKPVVVEAMLDMDTDFRFPRKTILDNDLKKIFDTQAGYNYDYNSIDLSYKSTYESKLNGVYYVRLLAKIIGAGQGGNADQVDIWHSRSFITVEVINKLGKIN
jgi:hypothetical protein